MVQEQMQLWRDRGRTWYEAAELTRRWADGLVAEMIDEWTNGRLSGFRSEGEAREYFEMIRMSISDEVARLYDEGLGAR